MLYKGLSVLLTLKRDAGYICKERTLQLLHITHICCWRENSIHKCINTLMNHRSHMIVIPIRSKRRCGGFELLKRLCLYQCLFVSKPVVTLQRLPKDILKGRATGLLRKTVTLPFISLATKRRVYMACTLMCACLTVITSTPQGFGVLGFAATLNMIYTFSTLHVQTHGSKGIAGMGSNRTNVAR